MGITAAEHSLAGQLPQGRCSSFTLSWDLDPNQIEATLEHGVLKLRFHKVAQAQAKRIEVKSL